MGLVHETEGDLGVAGVFGGDLSPQAGELSVGGSSLADNGTVPARVVMHVNDAKTGTTAEAALDKRIVVGPVGGVQGTTEGVVYEVLPSYGQTEGVESIVLNEVVHLVDSGCTRVDNATSVACSVGAAAEVKSRDVDTSVLDFSSCRLGDSRCGSCLYDSRA
jgi:hypothetical protein